MASFSIDPLDVLLRLDRVLVVEIKYEVGCSAKTISFYSSAF